MNGEAFLIVKLAAAGDVLLATALARGLRHARPGCTVGWLTTAYAAPLLEANPDVDEILLAGGGVETWRTLRRWNRRHPGATVLLAHRASRLALLLRAAGGRRLVGYENGRNWGLSATAPFAHGQHRLERDAGLLRAAGVEPCPPLAPRLWLAPAERAAGERVWRGAQSPRWALAPGGASNPWSAMPNRRWPPERFLELGRRAVAHGVALRWLGGPGDAALVGWIAARLPGGELAHCAGKLTLRQTAAVIAASDLVVANDSLPLVMAHALQRPGLGLYGPTAGAEIHAPGQPFLQGQAGCGPCYDPRAGTRGQAYRCPRARCMEQLEVEDAWQRALACGPTQGERAS